MMLLILHSSAERLLFSTTVPHTKWCPNIVQSGFLLNYKPAQWNRKRKTVKINVDNADSVTTEHNLEDYVFAERNYN